jgi:hypothetical protein
VKLFSASWVRRLQRLTRQEAKLSMAIWREYRRRRRWWNRVATKLLAVFFFVFVPFALLVRVFDGLHGNNEYPLSGLSLLATGLAFWRANRFTRELYAAGDRVLLVYFPLSREVYWQFQRRRFFCSGLFHLWFLMAFGGMACLVGALTRQHWPWILGVVAIQWILMMGLGVILACWSRPTAYGLIGLGFVALAIALLLRPMWLSGVSSTIIDFSLQVLPAGWVAEAFRAGVVDGRPITWQALVPVTLIMASSVFCLGMLRRRFCGDMIDDAKLLEAPLPTVYDEEERILPAQPEVSPSVLRDVEEQIRQRKFLVLPDWGAPGAMDRFLTKLLTTRERQLLQFLLEDTPARWTRRWRSSVMVPLVGVTLAILIPHPSAWLVIPIALLVSSGYAGQLLGGSWGGLGGNAPDYARYPIGYWQFARIVLKTSCARWLAWWPIPVACGMAAAWKLGDDLSIGAVMGAHFAGLAIAAQPALVVIRISASTADTSGYRLRDVRRIIAICTIILFLVVFGMLSLAPGSAGVIGLAVTACVSWGFLAWYGHWYNAIHFDLMPRASA